MAELTSAKCLVSELSLGAGAERACLPVEASYFRGALASPLNKKETTTTGNNNNYY